MCAREQYLQIVCECGCGEGNRVCGGVNRVIRTREGPAFSVLCEKMKRKKINEEKKKGQQDA